MNFIVKLSGLVLLALLLLSSPDVRAADTETRQDIENLLHTENLSIRGVDILTQGLLLDSYEDHEFAPYWASQDKIRELMDLIGNATDHGLNPSDYNAEALNQVLQRRQARPSAEIEAEADILLTESLFRYGYHRRFGKVKANELDPNINFRREHFHHQSPSKTLEQALDSKSLTVFVETIAPT